jgi:hypothetical protein
MSTGKLLTHHIPVVVATGEVTLATIAADAGDEDNAVRRIKFEAQAIGLDVTVNAFGEPLTVSEVDPGGPAAKQGVEVGDLLIDANGQSIPTDRPEAELRRIFAGFKRPVTLGFYKLRKATEQARRASIDVRGGDVRGVAVRPNGSSLACGETCPASHPASHPRVVARPFCAILLPSAFGHDSHCPVLLTVCAALARPLARPACRVRVCRCP